MYGVIALFVHILHFPMHQNIESHLTLLDIGAGFFARLKFTTDSDISIDFAKDLATVAHQVVVKAQKTSEEDGSVVNEDKMIARMPQVPVTELSDCDLQNLDLITPHNMPEVSITLSHHPAQDVTPRSWFRRGLD